MADNIAVTAGSGTTVATDEVSGVHYQRVKPALGSDGVAVDAVGGAGAVGNGVQRMTLASDDPAVAAVQVMDDWDESDRCKVNPIAGQAGVAGGSGDVSALTQRVVLASDVALPAGTNNIGDVDVASIAAGTNYIGQVAAPMQFVTVTMSTPTDALDAGDVVAATQVVAAATRANDVPAILESMTIIDPDEQAAKLTVVLFDANTSLGTEDAAPDMDDTEALTVLGMIEIAAADWVDLGGADVVHKKDLGIIVKPATGTDDIYMAIFTPDTSTPTYAGGALTVRLGFKS